MSVAAKPEEELNIHGLFLVAFKDTSIQVEITAPTTDEAVDTDLLEENLQRASSYEDNKRLDILFYAINTKARWYITLQKKPKCTSLNSNYGVIA